MVITKFKIATKSISKIVILNGASFNSTIITTTSYYDLLDVPLENVNYLVPQDKST
jgi:hypothetical protein